MQEIFQLLENACDRSLISKNDSIIFKGFCQNYQAVCAPLLKREEILNQLHLYLTLILKNLETPPVFSVFHQAIRQPIDYYQFGLDMIRPLIDRTHSQLNGLTHLDAMNTQIKKGENVILFANHQTEPDPQIISLMIEQLYPELAANMIFVAGHRVLEDPLAVPMSLGRNLLCIHSKKYMAHPPELKSTKILHNQRTLQKMEELLNQGGCCIYVALSGGRDRTIVNESIYPDPINPQSLELFYLIAQKSKKKVHFNSLALKTHELMPPPDEIKINLGETRRVNRAPVFLAFGPELDVSFFALDKPTKKKAMAKEQASIVYAQLLKDYEHFPN